MVLMTWFPMLVLVSGKIAAAAANLDRTPMTLLPLSARRVLRKWAGLAVARN
jgi:hypothetical protein